MDLAVSTRGQRQHYVPRTYLKRFASPNEQVLVKDLTLPEKPAFRTHINKICVECGINDLSTLSTGVSANLYEKILGNIEGQYDERLRTSIDKGFFPTPSEVGMVNIFVVHQLFRTPAYRSLISEKTEELFSENPNIKFSTVSFLHAIRGVPQLLEFAEYQVIRASRQNKFITSDNPATAWLHKGLEWHLVETRLNEEEYQFLKIICPLSPDFLLMIQPLSLSPDMYIRRGSIDAEVEKLNNLIWRSANRFVIS